MQHPTSSHTGALDHVLKNIYGTTGQDFLIKGTNSLELTTYSDLD